jgi:indole-3-glycerol phosphate synthase
MPQKVGLAKFREAKAAEIERLRRDSLRTIGSPSGPKSLEGLGEGLKPKKAADGKPDFLASLLAGQKKRGLALIAEYKRASPSLGDIDLAITPQEAAKAYAAAEAISVLTEETYFKGSLSFVGDLAQAGRPILRKDFIFDPLQVLATAATAASAILLIVRLTPESTVLRELVELSLEFGLTPVVEIFDRADLKLAREAGAKVIQVNARDLETLIVDPAARLRLIQKFPPKVGEFWIAASGISRGQELVELRAAGFGAALIGSALMGSGSPQSALNSLVAELEGF